MNGDRVVTMRMTRYASEHLDAILALHRTATAGLHLGISQDEDETDLMQIEHVYLADGGEFLVGFFQGELIAMGGFKKLSDTAAELRRIRIQPKLQNRGYGGLLLRELERRAVERGIRTMYLSTARTRPLTLEFYRKHGYEERGQGVYGAVETVKFEKILQTTDE